LFPFGISIITFIMSGVFLPQLIELTNVIYDIQQAEKS
jgi:hypothetical protein